MDRYCNRQSRGEPRDWECPEPKNSHLTFKTWANVALFEGLPEEVLHSFRRPLWRGRVHCREHHLCRGPPSRPLVGYPEQHPCEAFVVTRRAAEVIGHQRDTRQTPLREMICD